MKRDYTTRCWLCGSPNLEPDARGIRCRGCNATYTLISKPACYPLTTRYNPATGLVDASPSDALLKETALPLVSNRTLH